MKFFLVVSIILICALSCKAEHFAWQQCGPKNQTIQIKSLSVHFQDNTFKVSTDVEVQRNITGPVELYVTIRKEILWNWVKIPCEDNIGSCHYPDMCTLFNGLLSLEKASDSSVTCKYPILKGQYSIKDLIYHIKHLPKWLEEGSYKAETRFREKNEELLCLRMSLTI